MVCEDACVLASYPLNDKFLFLQGSVVVHSLSIYYALRGGKGK